MSEAKTEEKQPQELPQQPKEAIAVQEPKPEATAINEWEKLKEFQSQWHQVLEQGSSIGIPRMLKIQQGNEVRYFYALRDLGRQEEEQKLAFTLRCLRDDMEIFDVKTIVQLAPFGPTAVKHEFHKVDPEKSELNPSDLLQLVQTILKGETPL